MTCPGQETLRVSNTHLDLSYVLTDHTTGYGATQVYPIVAAVQNEPGTSNVLDIWPHIDPGFGGIGPAAAALAHAVQSCRGWQSNLLAICDRPESNRHKDIPPTVKTVVEQSRRPLADHRLTALLKAEISKAHVCHIHGIWSPHSLAATRAASRVGIPVVSSVHGMLEKWDLAKGRRKKQIYSALFQRASLATSACLRALSEREFSDMRAYGLDNPIAIVPNGVNESSRVTSSALLERLNLPNDKRVVLFLGRIHRKKGILELLRAWPEVVRQHPDAHLLIAGADYEGAVGAALQIISDLKLRDSVMFCGVLNGDETIQALSTAVAFCLPSYSEGMSVAVLEALSIGTPVIITPACNVSGIVEAGAGYVTSTEPKAISESICDCLSLSGVQWRSMSESARLLARSRYSWSRAGDSMRAVYEWLLGGSKPDCVIT
jgi:glycosyltransferase involved in cell wall biosynthesis